LTTLGRGLVISDTGANRDVTVVDRQLLLCSKYSTVNWPWEDLIREAEEHGEQSTGLDQVSTTSSPFASARRSAPATLRREKPVGLDGTDPASEVVNRVFRSRTASIAGDVTWRGTALGNGPAVPNSLIWTGPQRWMTQCPREMFGVRRSRPIVGHAAVAEPERRPSCAAESVFGDTQPRDARTRLCGYPQ
jgi:hypothetical protein